jgi:hypothetical protein
LYPTYTIDERAKKIKPSSTGSPGGGGGIGTGGFGAAKVIGPHKIARVIKITFVRLIFIGRKSIKKNALSKFFTSYFGRWVKQIYHHVF